MTEENLQNEEYMVCDVEFQECILDGKTIYKCSKCEKFFSETKLLVEHYSSEHTHHDDNSTSGFQKENFWKCTCCKMTCAKKNLLEKHTKSVHEENFINVFHKCLLCEKAFKDTQLLASHINKTHVEIPLKVGSYKCPINERFLVCSAEYKSANGISNHILRDHGVKVHKCAHCFDRFSAEQNLLTHLRTTHAIPVSKIIQNTSGRGFLSLYCHFRCYNNYILWVNVVLKPIDFKKQRTP